MDDRWQRETENLTKSWMQHDSAMLRDYLTAGVEDPRVNTQSVLTRHSLLVALFGQRFEKLLEAELRFAAVMNWIMGVMDQVGSAHDLRAIRHALAKKAEDAEGIAIPRFASGTFASLPANLDGVVIANYVEEWIDRMDSDSINPSLDEALLSTFQRAWAQALPAQVEVKPSVLELGCGSANDYRSLEACGLARLIDYTGLDLCEKNIENARAMFPNARFSVGNVLDIDRADAADDFCVAHDLFEHLSLDALERALDEICRVARRGLSLGFFNLHEGDEHIAQPVEDYHWNRLSVPRLREGLERRGFQTQVVHVGTFLKWRLGVPSTHNNNAYTFLAERVSEPSRE